MIIISPCVVSDEKDAFRGSIRRTTPIAAKAMPANFASVNFSVPRIAPTASVKIGIVTASNDVFDAFVRDKPPINRS